RAFLLQLKGEKKMKLIIKRDQKAQTNILGGHKGMTFLLTTRVELTPEEQELVKRYKVENYPLTTSTMPDGRVIPRDTIANLLRGTSQELKDIIILRKNEEEIKNACSNFRDLLDIMATFGGEEVVEF